jgi:RND family efflux transporter MFP subunit
MRATIATLLLAAMLAVPAAAGTVTLAPTTIPEWKAVYGRIEARDSVPARARLGGTLVALEVTEGDTVSAGQRIATVRDDKIAFQIDALDAQLRALRSQLENAESELARGEALVAKGVATTQRVDQLRTAVDVVRNQVAATEAQRAVVVQQGTEGEVLAPAGGKVLSVPVTRGAVIMPGEPVAVIGGGGFFLRLAIPERHAAMLQEGAALEIETAGGKASGRLAKVYPRIENGRVVADVEVEGLDTAFVEARVLVRVPVGERPALLVPAAAVAKRFGIDFVRVKAGEGEVERAVITGEAADVGGTPSVEILTGLVAGDEVILP